MSDAEVVPALEIAKIERFHHKCSLAAAQASISGDIKSAEIEAVSNYPPIVVYGTPPAPQVAERRLKAIEYVRKVAKNNDRMGLNKLADALGVPTTGTILDERSAIINKIFELNESTRGNGSRRDG
jgi:hypothetical protein